MSIGTLRVLPSISISGRNRGVKDLLYICRQMDSDKPICKCCKAGGWLRVLVMLLTMLAVESCHKRIEHPEDVARQTFVDAVEALGRGDYDAYLSYVDFGEELDSAALACMADVVRRHEEWKCAEREGLVGMEIVDVKMKSDTVCFIYYEHVFVDSCREVVSQKMVAKEGKWKLRVRN